MLPDSDSCLQFAYWCLHHQNCLQSRNSSVSREVRAAEREGESNAYVKKPEEKKFAKLSRNNKITHFSNLEYNFGKNNMNIYSKNAALLTSCLEFDLLRSGMIFLIGEFGRDELCITLSAGCNPGPSIEPLL